MTTRLPWPDGFKLLVEDRRVKGFSVIQFAVAFPCDIEPFDERGANEAGHAWTRDWGSIRPEYFERTDERIEWLVSQGLVPNMVGAWGYYLPFMGVERVKQHWRYLVARYGAYPVTWTLCGESTLIWYRQPGTREELEAHRKQQSAGWTDVARFIRQTDPFHRLLTVHPGPASGRFRPIDDMQLLDFVMLQPGHSDFETLPVAIQNQRHARELFPSLPVLMGEVCFEGMQGGACGPKIQRNLFWTSVLSGAPGFCYGVDALWQFNTRTQPFGPSPAGQIWGNAPWEEAYQWPGSRHLGLGRQILDHHPWWRMEPHPDWIEPAGDAEHPLEPFAAGIPGELRLFYFPRHVAPWSKPYHVVDLEPDVTYAATYIDPLTGDRHPLPPVVPDANRRWRVPPAPILQDWLLEFSARSSRETLGARSAGF